jgi:hypothetical protein
VSKRGAATALCFVLNNNCFNMLIIDPVNAPLPLPQPCNAILSFPAGHLFSKIEGEGFHVTDAGIGEEEEALDMPGCWFEAGRAARAARCIVGSEGEND